MVPLLLIINNASEFFALPTRPDGSIHQGGKQQGNSLVSWTSYQSKMGCELFLKKRINIFTFKIQREIHRPTHHRLPPPPTIVFLFLFNLSFSCSLLSSGSLRGYRKMSMPETLITCPPPQSFFFSLIFHLSSDFSVRDSTFMSMFFIDISFV